MDKKPSIGCVIYTHERIDDAKINMEIIRSVWQRAGLFSAIRIVHAYNGRRAWHPQKYLEDVIIRQKNPGHYQGAADLIDGGLSALHKKYPELQYVVVLAADTWCLKPGYITRAINTMRQKKKHLTTCPWGLPDKYKENGVGLAADFFVVDLKWAWKYRLFPLRYYTFWKKYHVLISYLRPGGNVSVERLMLARFHEASFLQCKNNVRRRELAENRLLILKERLPVHSGKNKQGYWQRRFYWPKIGLVTHHDPKAKKNILLLHKAVSGKNISRLRRAKDLSYYNQGRTIRASYD